MKRPSSQAHQRIIIRLVHSHNYTMIGSSEKLINRIDELAQGSCSQARLARHLKLI